MSTTQQHQQQPSDRATETASLVTLYLDHNFAGRPVSHVWGYLIYSAGFLGVRAVPGEGGSAFLFPPERVRCMEVHPPRTERGARQ